MLESAARLAAPVPAEAHVLPVRVYYEDTDAGGMTYHTSYLRFAERARTEMLRALGFHQSAMLETDGIAFVVTRCDVEFKAPARLDDMLEVVSRVAEIGAASIRFLQIIRCDGRDLVVARVRIACINLDGHAVRLPARFREAMARAAGNDSGERGEKRWSNSR